MISTTKRISFGSLHALAWASVVLIAGCAPNTAMLRQHLDSGAYEKAVAATAGDPRLETALATLIIADAAADEANALAMIDVLRQAGRAGRDVLETLAEKRDLRGRLAALVLMDPDDVDAKTVNACRVDPHGDVRTVCVRDFYGAFSEHDLAAALLDTDPRVRYFAVKGLEKKYSASGDARHQLREALRQDPSSKVREAAAETGPLLGEDAYLQLTTALSDENDGVRLAALRGIATLQMGAGFKRLEDIAWAKMDLMAVAAAAELARCGFESGVTRLRAALADPRPTIRIAALMRLERAAFPDRPKAVAAVLRDKAPDVVLAAADLLRNDRTRRPLVISALRRLVKEGGHMKNAARDRLAVLGDAPSIKETKAAMAEADTETLLEILGRINGASDLRVAIVPLMGQAEKAVRIAAARGLLSRISPA